MSPKKLQIKHSLIFSLLICFYFSKQTGKIIKGQITRQNIDNRLWELPTLHPKEQKRKGSNRFLLHISHKWELLLPPLTAALLLVLSWFWGLSFRKRTLALLITYVWTPLISKTFWISVTLTTSWYEDLLICICTYTSKDSI